ncbi:MAG: hypothetical protein ACXADY_19820 [Candidatus Hodarchaeales archaeon]|jgi:hypothetical protein
MFDERYDNLKNKYNDTESHKLKSKFKIIEKLLGDRNETEKKDDRNSLIIIENQIFDVISELEYINYFENLLDIRLSDNEIDKLLPNSKKDFDIFLALEEFNVWIDVKNPSNIVKRHNSTVNEFDISNSTETAERLQRKLLHNISEKIAGINTEDFHDPIVIALSPYTSNLIHFITPVIEAIQSPLKYNTLINKFIAEDPNLDPFQNFQKEKMLFTGVFYSQFYSDQNGNYDLNVLYFQHYHAKNKFPPLLLQRMKKCAEKRGFSPKIIPSKVQSWKVHK